MGRHGTIPTGAKEKINRHVLLRSSGTMPFMLPVPSQECRILFILTGLLMEGHYTFDR